MNCYTLTVSVNAYDQYGEYLLVVFKDLPTLGEINTACTGSGYRVDKESYSELVTQGSCNDSNDILYLTKVEFSKLYQNLK